VLTTLSEKEILVTGSALISTTLLIVGIVIIFTGILLNTIANILKRNR